MKLRSVKWSYSFCVTARKPSMNITARHQEKKTKRWIRCCSASSDTNWDSLSHSEERRQKKKQNRALLALSSAFLFTLNSAVTQHVTRQQSLSNQTGEALMCKRFTLMFPDASVFMRLLQSCVVWSFWTSFQCFLMWMCRSFPAEQANILWNRQFMWHYFLIRRRNFTLCVKMWNPDVKKQISCDFTCAVLFLHVDILMYMGKISHRDVFIFMWKSD